MRAKGYARLEMMQVVGERNVKVVPDVAVNGGNGQGGLVEALLGLTMKQGLRPPG